MFQLLTADDEPDKLEALRSQCDWPSYQVEICGEAQTGIEAYEQIVAKKPDICIMDIKMPLLSGLDVIRRAQTMGVRTKYVILSGYDEFDYAKEAISLSVVDYLLKPCRPEDIARSVQKCIRLLEDEKKQSKLQEDYDHLLQDSAGSNRERLLSALMLGVPVESLGLREEMCRLQALGSTVAVCVFDPTQAADESRGRNDPAKLRRQVEAAFAAWPSAVLAVEDKIAAVTGMDRVADDFGAFYGALKDAVDRCCNLCGVSCAVGVSDCRQDVSLLNGAYLEARQAAETSKFLFERSILFFAELNRESSLSVPENPEIYFLRNLEDSEKTAELIDRFLKACTACSADVQEKTKESAVTLVCSLYKLCRERGFSFNGLSKRKSADIRQILESDSLEKIRSVLTDFIQAIGKNMASSNSVSSLVRRTIAYIQSDYRRHITLESAAEVIHVTPSYLSMLFRQQTGSTFVEYVNRFRVRKACDLLRAGSLKSYEVAFDVGFQDEKYFHNIFKRYTGMTTKQFRDGARACAEPEEHDAFFGPSRAEN